uniref:ANK_REP_REGION domain-containing protein n=1 Tax=Syphacia muris TaxID=451379 RepID=A0A0N5AF80_9BILA
MGNRESANADNEGVKKQRDEEVSRTIYKLVGMHGDGELIPWVRFADSTGEYSNLDLLIDTKVKDLMYNSGKGQYMAKSELIKIRNKERNERLSRISRKKGKGKSGPNILADFNQEGANQGDINKALKLLDGGGKGGKGGNYRNIAWKLDERGTMGETIVGICLLQGTKAHNSLAVRLMQKFPLLVKDIFVSEDYYGLTPLHQAVVNEDPQMVNFLLQHGADVNERCFGARFCPEDQVSSRTDSLEHEYVELSPKTSYVGRMYFGEYPLSFAVCINQIDCYRLLISKKADPNAKDTNGNTVLHLAVIHEKPEMLRLAYNTGGKLHVMNKQNLTPLTLAARLAKKKMFEEILKLESDVMWLYGDASSQAYPLANIDTINQKTGGLNEDSALSLIVYGETTRHLDLLDGLLEDLLQAKWEAFGKKRLVTSFFSFIVYYVLVFTAFMCRPFSMTTQVRMFAEPIVVSLALLQIILEITDIRSIGRKRWWQVLKSFPAKVVYKISLLVVLLIVPIRFSCSLDPVFLLLDNVLTLIAVIFTGIHFLFYTRAQKFIGPFVLMIYTILSRDLSRFFLIYAIFLMGFSQSFYLIFGACTRAKANEEGKSIVEVNNIMDSPLEAIIRLFIMTIGEFTVLYRELNGCRESLMQVIGKILFILFQLSISIMQFNLLIAMMTRTYEKISGTQKEWKRQWAQVILMLELSLKPKDRLTALLKYSKPIGTDKERRAFVVVRKTVITNIKF